MCVCRVCAHPFPTHVCLCMLPPIHMCACVCSLTHMCAWVCSLTHLCACVCSPPPPPPTDVWKHCASAVDEPTKASDLPILGCLALNSSVVNSACRVQLAQVVRIQLTRWVWGDAACDTHCTLSYGPAS